MTEKKTNPKVRKRQYTISKIKTIKQGISWQRDFRLKFRLRGAREISVDALEVLATLMLEWINHSEELYDIRHFLFYQKILKHHLQDFRDKCPKLDEAVTVTYQKIAYNRERNALAKDPAGIAFKHMQGTYDPEWKAQEGYFNKLKADAEASKFSNDDARALIADILKNPDGK